MAFYRWLACSLILISSLAFAQYPQAWTAFKNVASPTDDGPSDVRALPDGGFLAFGEDTGSAVIVKLDATGGKMWTRAVPGFRGILATNANSFSVATLVHQGYGNNVVVQKFDFSGNLLWAKSITGEADEEFGHLPQMVMDAGGGVIVSQTLGDPYVHTSTETVRFDSSTGVKTFDIILDIPGGFSTMNALHCDSTGAAYVDTYQYVNGVGSDVLLKYAPNGSVIWSKTLVNQLTPYLFDGSGNSYGYGLLNNVPTLTKYDANLNVLWTQTSNLPTGGLNASIAPGGDVLVLANAIGTGTTMSRFGSDGSFEWTTSLPGYYVGAAKYDSLGNIYLAGSAIGPSSVAIVKFSSGGSFQWAKSELLDPTNIYGGGSSCALNKDGTALLLYPKANPTTYTDFHGSAYSSTGTNLWSNDYDLQRPYEYPFSSVTDPSGATYIADASWPIASSDIEDFWLIRFSATGSVSWSRRLFPTEYNNTSISVVAVGGGAAIGNTIEDDTYSPVSTNVYRYDAAGNLLWTYVLTSKTTYLSDMKASSDGSIFLLEYVNGGLGAQYQFAKLNSSGVLQWSTLLPDPTGVGGRYWAVDPSGNMFISYSSYDADTLEQDAAIAKVDSSGQLVWIHRIPNSDPESNFDTGDSIGLDSAGAIYWLATTGNSPPVTSLNKLGTSGNQIWSMPTGMYFYHPSMCVDSLHNVFLSGTALDESGLITKKVSPLGQVVWTAPGAGGLLPDGSGGVFAIGTTVSVNGYDTTVTRFASDGSKPWPASGGQFVNGTLVHDEGGFDNDVCGFGLDAAGNMYIAGAAYGPSGSRDANVVKFNARDSHFSTQSVPASMIAGQTYAVSTTFQNTGFESWTAPNYKLGLTGSSWGVSTVSLSGGETIAPGQSRKFSFNIYAPVTPGTYNFQDKMYNGTASFGSLSPVTSVVVVLATDAARYVSQSQPLSVVADTTFNVTVDMRNVGTNTWTKAAGYALAAASGYPTWSVTTVPLATGDSIAKGFDKVFTFGCKAPATPGTYTMRFQMVRNGVFFGDRTTVKTITVTPN